MSKTFNFLLNLEFIYLLGLWLFFLMVYGLTINSVLPIFGIQDPLSLKYIWPIYLITLPLFLKLIHSLTRWLFGSNTPLLLKILIIINPIIATFGVYRLDNTGDGRLAMSSVILVCLTFLYTLIKKDLHGISLSASLYSSALSLILANSLRSHYLVGWDIHQEFLVFNLTNLHNFWDINTFRDAYNACLSITILPTIIHNAFGISPLTIYKFVYPLLISTIPIIVYQIGSRITNPKLAYVGAFTFLLQAQFFSQLPALLRQSIAFIFFALLIDVLIRPNINQVKRNLVFLIFGIGMILSHYSTTYIALAVLLVTKVISVLFNRFWPCKEKIKPLSYRMTLILFIVAFLWNTLITDTTGGLAQIAQKVVTNIGSTFSLDNKSDMVKAVFYKQTDNNSAVNRYYQQTLQSVNNPDQFKGYEITPVSLFSGKRLLLRDPVPVYFHIVIPWVFRISILVGLISLIVIEFRRRQSPLIISLGLAMFFVIFCLVLLPYVSLNYNFERLFQQMLVLLAPVSAIGLYNIFYKIKVIPVSFPILIILTSYLTQTTGLIDKIAYDNKTWMFDNTGEQYYRYYTTLGEISGITWLKFNTIADRLIYTDKYTKLRITGYASKKYAYISSQINPPVIEKFGYVVSGLAGTKAHAVFSEAYNGSMIFSFPTKYLNDQKNMIYTNSLSTIYK